MQRLDQLKEIIVSSKFTPTLEQLYVDNDLFDAQRVRYIKAVEEFEKLFPEDAKASIFTAAGRTEICGNHTDHQHGKVLAASLNIDSLAVAAPNSLNKIRLQSEGYDYIEFDTDDLSVKANEEGTTISLIRGVANGLVNRDYKVGGFDAYVTSNVLGGSGLSSSASFEVLIGNIFSELFNNQTVDPVEIAQISQYAENVYFGKPCGLMDQMACSVGGIIGIDFEDPKFPIVKKIDFDFAKTSYSICITDTHGSHADLTDCYAAIPAEMCSVAKALGKEFMREVSMEEMRTNINKLREECGDRAFMRALHFMAEEKNVDSAVAALEENSLEKFFMAITNSGFSSANRLQNIHDPRNPKEQSLLVALMASSVVLGQDCGAYRVHGGGFAGTIQAFVPDKKLDEYKTAMDSIFGQGSCAVLKIRNVGGSLAI